MQIGKFIVPDSAVEVIPRPTLETRLLKSVADRVITLVIAPAGSGKSLTLIRLYECCRAASLRPVWFSCEPSDRDEAHFFGLLEQAIAGEDGKQTRHTDPDDLAGSVRRLGVPVVLFLDNYHLCENPELNQSLLRLAQSCGQNLHIVLSSRILPEIDFAAWRLRSKLGEFSRSDLAIGEDEVARFIHVEDDLLSQEQRQEIVARTEGWAAALQFIRLLLAEGGSLDQIVSDLSVTDQNIQLYLYEEVFKALSADMRAYLLSIAHLDRFSAQLGGIVSNLPNAAALFDEVIDRNLFVIPMDRKRSWIKLHSVFRDFLIMRARRECPHDLRDQLLSAARWHWANDDWLDAVRYAIDAGEHALAAQWLQSSGEIVVTDRGEVAAFRACCEQIADTGAPGTDLIQWMVWTAAFSMSPTDAAGLLTRHLGEAGVNEDKADRTVLLRALLSYFSHDFYQTLDLGHRWWEGADNATRFDRATVAAMMSFVLKTMLRQTQSRIWLVRAREEIANSSGGYGKTWVYGISAYMALIDGRPLTALEEAQRVMSDICAPSISSAIIEPVLAAASYERNLIDQAGRLAASSIENPDLCTALDMAFCAYRISAMLRLHSAGAEAAIVAIDGWENRIARRFGSRGIVMLKLLRQDIASRVSRQHRQALDRRFGLNSWQIVDRSWSSDLIEWAELILARNQLIDGDPRKAMDQVRGILLSARHDGRWVAWTEASLVKAAAVRALGDVRAAERTLIDCLTCVAPMGLARTILDNALLLRPFAAFLSDADGPVRHLGPETKALIYALSQEIGVAPPLDYDREERNPVEALTRQESTILALLADGFTNAEICERLLLSTATVKWHIYNLYQKLNVHSRTAAVREGRALGLLK